MRQAAAPGHARSLGNVAARVAQCEVQCVARVAA